MSVADWQLGEVVAEEEDGAPVLVELVHPDGRRERYIRQEAGLRALARNSDPMGRFVGGVFAELILAAKGDGGKPLPKARREARRTAAASDFALSVLLEKVKDHRAVDEVRKSARREPEHCGGPVCEPCNCRCQCLRCCPEGVDQ